MRALLGPHPTLGATLPRDAVWQSLGMDIVITLFSMFAILKVATGSSEKGITVGLAIGGVVGLCALSAGPISGASMNPARSIAPAPVSGQLRHLWIYLLAPLIGAALAVPAWRSSRSVG